MSVVKLAFTKYHGNGNDFIIFDLVTKNDLALRDTIINSSSNLCDRHQGIGGDGIILLEKFSQMPSHDRYHMTVVNADGSIAKNCGNGLRCAAAYLFATYASAQILHLDLENNSYACEQVLDGIAVSMGMCKIEPWGTDWPLATLARGHIGNEHVVFVVPDHQTNDDLLRLAEKFIPHTRDVNIGFVSFCSTDDRIFSRVFERGAGWTKSCGTGACIAAALSKSLQRSDQSVVVSQPGGDITVELSLVNQVGQQSTYKVTQRGSAVEIFTGICQLKKS